MTAPVDPLAADIASRIPIRKAAPRARPHVEVLEMRCLMSGRGGRVDPFEVRSHAIRAAVGAEVRTERTIRLHRNSVEAVAQSPTTTARSSPADDDSTYGTSDANPLPSLVSGRPNVPPGSYTVIVETTAPHHTLATAQWLPDLPFFGVVGTLSAGDAPDFYRLTLNEQVEQINFGLAFGKAGSDVPVEFQILNEQGQLLGEWSSDQQGSAVLLAQLGAQSAGTTLYLGISVAGVAGASTSSGIGYQLWVSRQADSQQSTAAASDPTAPVSAGFSPTSSGALVPLAAFASSPAGATAQTTAAAPSGAGANSPVVAAIGSPGILAGRPSVLGLSRDQSDPWTEPELPAVVHQDLAARKLTDSPPMEPIGADSASQPPSEQAVDALVAIDGPGGFALLGATAIGHRRRNPAPLETNFSTSPATPEPTPTAAGEFIVHDAALAAVDPALAEDRSLAAGRWVAMPNSLFSGLGLAIALTLNAALSQPFGGFDYLASRFDSRQSKAAGEPGTAGQ